MDTKKANLTPELKEIYDRVMNTSGGSKNTTPVATSQPLQPATPQVANPLEPAASAMPPPPPQPLTAKAAETTAPAPSMPPAAPVMAPAQASSMPSMPGSAEEALSNTPARPITEGNTFSFSGTAPAASPAPTPASAPPAQDAKPAKGKPKISLPILLVVGLIFIIVWGVFWAIIFGFIKR